MAILKSLSQKETITIRPQHLQKTVQLVQQAMLQKQQRESISFLSFTLQLVRFIGWKVWLAQLIFLTIFHSFLITVYGDDFFSTPSKSAFGLCCLAVFVLWTAVPFLQRSYRYQMFEMEAASKASIRRLLVAQLFIVALGDTAMLTAVFGLMLAKSSLSVGSIALYLVFSALLAGSGLLFILGHSKRKFFAFRCSLWFGGFSLGLFGLYRFFPAFFLQSFDKGWMIICLVLLGFCLYQVYHLQKQVAVTECF